MAARVSHDSLSNNTPLVADWIGLAWHASRKSRHLTDRLVLSPLPLHHPSTHNAIHSISHFLYLNVCSSKFESSYINLISLLQLFYHLLICLHSLRSPLCI
jgi:hypothetical protein